MSPFLLVQFEPPHVGCYEMKSFSTFAPTPSSILMSGGQRRLKPSPANFFVASIPSLLPAVSRARQCVFADEKIARAEGCGALQKQNGAQGCQWRGEPRAVQLAVFCRNPGGDGKAVGASQLLGSCGEIRILHL